MRPSCAMNISEGRIQFNSPTAQIDFSVEDFNTMQEMYELITNNYYYSDFCFSDDKGKWVVGNLKDQMKDG